MAASRRVVHSPRRLRGEVVVPGDKSISHRALILNAVAHGDALVSNLCPGADVHSTLCCLRQLGVTIEERSGGTVLVKGSGLDGLREPEEVLDAGNSGTTTRLLIGLLAGQPFFSTITGDRSLRSRPMGRVVLPLREMGAAIQGRRDGTLLPLAIGAARLHGIEYTLPVASAQLKSALLLAALTAQGPTTIHEPLPSRDHTERLLTAQGASISVDGLTLRLSPGRELAAVDVDVPGDLSSAAFWLVAAAIHPDAEVVVRGVGVNPGRTGVLEVLRAMGADVEVIPRDDRGGEPVADLVARSSRLKGIEIGAEIVPRLVDEIPVLAMAAAYAEGETVISGAKELRIKETDRLKALASEMGRLGMEVRELPDGLVVRGGGGAIGATCESYDDHRMAMAVAVAGLVAAGETAIEGAGAADISYPGFWSDLAGLSGGEIDA